MQPRRKRFLPLFHATQPHAQSVIRRRGIGAREAWAHILVFALVVITVGVFLRLDLATSYRHEAAYWRARQSSVAEDQAQRVSDWLEAGRAALQLFAARSLVRTVLQPPNDAGRLPRRPAGGRGELTAALDEIASVYSYDGIYLLDGDVHVVAQSSGSQPLRPVLREICQQVVATGSPRIDLVGKGPDDTLVSFAAAVVSAPRVPGATRTPGPPLGVVLAVFDAAHTLFPLVTRTAVPTRTGETVLVRREGNDVVYFSPLRHVPAGSPNLRYPFSATPLPARTALEGRETFVENNDYRGVPALTVTRYIPLTGWGLVNKIDRAEALEGFRRQATAEGLGAGLMIILLGGLLVFHRRTVLTRVLKQEEEKFRALLESVPDAIYILEPSTLRILGRNRKAAEMDGYSDEEVARMTANDLHPPEDHALLSERCEKGSETGGALPDHTLHHRRKDGRLVPVEERHTLVEAGGEQLVLSIARDLTERKRAELELGRLNRALRAISWCNQIIARAQSEQEILESVCKCLVEVCGYRMAYVGYAEQDEAKTVRPVAHAGAEEGFLALARITWADDVHGQGPSGSAIRSGRPAVIRSTAADANFAPWREEALKRGCASSIGLPLRAGPQCLGALTVYAAEPDAFDGAEVELLSELADDLGFGVDTIRTRMERKRAQEALEKRTQELTDFQKALEQKMRELARSNADLEQFAYVASHDLQEPLRTVASFAQLMKRRFQGKLDANGDDYIHFMVDGATRMQGLIHDLLAYSRVGRDNEEFIPTDTTAVYDQAITNLQMALAESAAVVTHDPLPTVKCDGAQLIQVFQNLIGNSLKFCNSKGPRVHMGVEQQASQWVFSVKDNGIGIDPQYAQRIFEVFQRLHPRTEYPGSGIGLAIAKKIVEHHGGRIWVESKLHQGATFFFTLPAGSSV